MVAMSVLSIAPVAAQGALLASFDVTTFTKKPVYFPIGVTFDGKDLWYSQPSTSSPGLFLATTSGILLRTLSLVFPTANGALAWDGTNLWVASFGGSGGATGEPFVFQVSTAGGGTVLKSLNLTSIFAADTQCGIIDGLAFDPSTGSLWVSPDVGCNFVFPGNICSLGFAYNIDTNGNLIRKIQFPFAVSGVAVANKNLYVAERCTPTSGTEGFSLIDQVGRNGQVMTSFPIVQVDPKSWAESIAFDPATFTATCAIWVMQPYIVSKIGSTASFLDHADAAAYGIPCQ